MEAAEKPSANRVCLSNCSHHLRARWGQLCPRGDSRVALLWMVALIAPPERTRRTEQTRVLQERRGCRRAPGFPTHSVPHVGGIGSRADVRFPRASRWALEARRLCGRSCPVQRPPRGWFLGSATDGEATDTAAPGGLDSACALGVRARRFARGGTRTPDALLRASPKCRARRGAGPPGCWFSGLEGPQVRGCTPALPALTSAMWSPLPRRTEGPVQGLSPRPLAALEA